MALKKEEKNTSKPKSSINKNLSKGIRRIRFQVSCQPEELALIRSAAKKAGTSLSRFVVDGALAEIKKIKDKR